MGSFLSILSNLPKWIRYFSHYGRKDLLKLSLSRWFADHEAPSFFCSPHASNILGCSFIIYKVLCFAEWLPGQKSCRDCLSSRPRIVFTFSSFLIQFYPDLCFVFPCKFLSFPHNYFSVIEKIFSPRILLDFG
jgi:hypothetical protein